MSGFESSGSWFIKNVCEYAKKEAEDMVASSCVSMPSCSDQNVSGSQHSWADAPMPSVERNSSEVLVSCDQQSPSMAPANLFRHTPRDPLSTNTSESPKSPISCQNSSSNHKKLNSEQNKKVSCLVDCLASIIK